MDRWYMLAGHLTRNPSREDLMCYSRDDITEFIPAGNQKIITEIWWVESIFPECLCSNLDENNLMLSFCYPVDGQLLKFYDEFVNQARHQLFRKYGVRPISVKCYYLPKIKYDRIQDAYKIIHSPNPYLYLPGEVTGLTNEQVRILASQEDEIKLVNDAIEYSKLLTRRLVK